MIPFTESVSRGSLSSCSRRQLNPALSISLEDFGYLLQQLPCHLGKMMILLIKSGILFIGRAAAKIIMNESMDTKTRLCIYGGPDSGQSETERSKV